MKKGLILYVGCALTYGTEEFKQDIADLKKSLSKVCIVLEFIGLVVGAAQDVYHHDININIRGCDLFVANCDQALIGLGYELAVQVEDRKKTALAVAYVDSKVTRLISGIRQPHFEFKRYQNFDDLYCIIIEKLKTL